MFFKQYSLGWRANENYKAMHTLFEANLPFHGMSCALAAVKFYVAEYCRTAPVNDLRTCVALLGLQLSEEDIRLLCMLDKYSYVLSTPTFDDDDLVGFSAEDLKNTELLVGRIKVRVTQNALRSRLTTKQPREHVSEAPQI